VGHQQNDPNATEDQAGTQKKECPGSKQSRVMYDYEAGEKSPISVPTPSEISSAIIPKRRGRPKKSPTVA
jgi:hypothetical protein